MGGGICFLCVDLILVGIRSDKIDINGLSTEDFSKKYIVISFLLEKQHYRPCQFLRFRQ